MTNEQVITRIKHNQMYKDDRETADYIIKALEQNTVSEEDYTAEYTARKQAEYELWKIKEQQPSEDCVSRQAVLDMAKSYNTDGWDSYTPLVVDVEDIEELPPVTPTRKVGKWENDKLFGECAYVCSFCHTIWTSSEIENMHYCPTCGTEMKGESNNDNP